VILSSVVSKRDGLFSVLSFRKIQMLINTKYRYKRLLISFWRILKCNLQTLLQRCKYNKLHLKRSLSLWKTEKVAFIRLDANWIFQKHQQTVLGTFRPIFLKKWPTCVINTCSVTENADKQFKQVVKKAMKLNDKALLLQLVVMLTETRRASVCWRVDLTWCYRKFKTLIYQWFE
jgi:hypothetical protein